MKRGNLKFFYSIVVAILCLTNAVAQQQKYTAPSLSDSNSWSIIMLPDPQTYQKFERNQPLFELMTAWISENIEKLNIQLVMCTGDLVEQNEMINPNGIAANQASKQQWASVRLAG